MENIEIIKKKRVVSPLFCGKKGKSGRKSRVKEIEGIVSKMKAQITNEALIELAKSRVYQQMVDNMDTANNKDFALPIALKGITEKQDITSNGKDITITSFRSE